MATAIWFGERYVTNQNAAFSRSDIFYSATFSSLSLSIALFTCSGWGDWKWGANPCFRLLTKSIHFCWEIIKLLEKSEFVSRAELAASARNIHAIGIFGTYSLWAFQSGLNGSTSEPLLERVGLPLLHGRKYLLYGIRWCCDIPLSNRASKSRLEKALQKMNFIY